MHDSFSAGDLAEFAEQSSPDGLFLRYARGRLRHFLNRQILGLLGAVFVGIVVSLPLGLLAGALILGGEVLDCFVLARLMPRVAKHGLQPEFKWLAVLSGGFQSGMQFLALLLCQNASPSPEMTFFLTSVITGVMINAGLVRAYFRAGTDLRLTLAGLALLALAVEEIRDLTRLPGQVFLFLATVVMLFLTITMLVRQSERAFFKHQELKRSMAERNADLRVSQVELARSGLYNQRLALAARHANDAIVFLDADNCYTWVNEAFTKMTGYTPEQAIGRHPGELLNGAETAVETLEKLAAARRDNKEIRVEIFNRGRDGRGYWVDTSIIPILDDAGNPVVTLAVEREITEAKQREADLAKAREEADAAVQAKSRFLANMSHEIRTPMNGVIGVTELLADTRLTKTQRDYVDTVLESARALLRIINDILDLSKLQSGAAAPEQRPMDLRHIVESVLRLLRPSAGAKGIDLELKVDSDLASDWQNVLGDEGKLRQILLNLVGNALKFTLKGAVTVRIGYGPLGMAIQVIDSGIGIESDRLSSIFDSFTQADDTISKRFGGTGLGLTISAMLAKQMGGEIRVNSKLGTGSCFALHLPLPAATTPSLPLGQAVPINPLTTAVNVLVAEDNRTNMLITRRILAGQVAQMSEATDGQSAVLMWQEEAPDLILMDISMPVMDGLAAAKAIRALEQKLGRPRCKILALTASSHWENQEACRAAGFDGYLVKPFRREALLQAIAEHCGSASALPVSRSA